ncbi:hypothetical protein PsorP6_000095 [Peronosclerospora sorghi]|uniref:Uncharacterized protein n=1 Tax=Peronosclerospora sorghi TaxID=230839 RepID=A0ACC0WVF4_9STRA|nr:hypothetical protein PsorP6_000095 [Peronosclerospora sorghi]
MQLAVRTITSIAQKGRLHGQMTCEVAAMFVSPEWAYLLPSFVKFCSCLLAVCFHAFTQDVLATNLIISSIDALIVLIETRSTAQEEALTLLLTIASQPKRLLLLANTNSVQCTRKDLCWNVAEAIALRFSELARRNADALAPSSHLFLDHLHGIAFSMTESEISGKFPSHILELLCLTMAFLTKKERGLYSLLMITIQKQLVTRVGATEFLNEQQLFRFHHARSIRIRANAAEIKQLMAIFLTGHLLKNQVVIEPRDRKSLVNWMLRLLVSANRDETLLHVMRFVRDEMSRFDSGSGSDQERAVLITAISQIFRKKGLCWTPCHEVLQRKRKDISVTIAFGCANDTSACDPEGYTTPIAVDTTDFVLRSRFGLPPLAFVDMDRGECEEYKKMKEQEYLMKICLLRELFQCYLSFASPIEQTQIVNAAFLLPSEWKQALDPDASESIGLFELHTVIWNLLCALDIAVALTNFVSDQYSLMVNSSASEHDYSKQYSRIIARLNVCLDQHNQLMWLLDKLKSKVSACLGDYNNSSGSRCADTPKHELEWLLGEVLIVEKFVNGKLRRVQGETPLASLFGLNFRVICLVFEGQLKHSVEPVLSVANEVELLRIFNQHLQSDVIPSSVSNEINSSSNGGKNLNPLISWNEGRQTLKWLGYRAVELSHNISNDGSAIAEENVERTKLMALSLAYIYESFIVILEECRLSTTAGNSNWTEKVMELLSVGVNPDVDLSHVCIPYGCSEVFFRCLARQCLELTDPTLISLATDALSVLVSNTRKSSLISQLCQALLHQTFPTPPTPCHIDIKFFTGLPLRPLPNVVVSPINGHICSLAKYRCTSVKWRHIAFLVVGSWSYAFSASAGSFLLLHYLEEMRVVIDAARSHNHKQLNAMKAANMDESDIESGEADMEKLRREDESSVVVDGEHIELKSLTNESLPYFVEAVLLCAIASFYRATITNATNDETALNPFLDYCRAMDVFQNTLLVFAEAEACGFNLPVKTNLLLLRAGTFVTRSVKTIITKCIGWRVEQSVSDNTSALEHLSILFGAACVMCETMETVTSTFQERVVLKMQCSGGNRRRGGWANELLAKTYGKKYTTRRWISKSETKLIPIFSHAIQELRDLLQDLSDVNNIDLESARGEWLSAESVWNDYEYRDVMLSDDKLVSACRSLQPTELTASMLKDWRPAVSAAIDNDETDFDDEEFAGDEEVDEESLSEDDGFAVKSYATTSAGHASSASSQKHPMVELQDNEDLGFPTIVFNFKKQKRTLKS